MKTNLLTIALAALFLYGCDSRGTTVAETPEARDARKMECSKTVLATVSRRIGSTSPTAAALALNGMSKSDVNNIMDGITECRGFGV